MSLFGLWARRCRKRVLLILVGSVAVEAAIFLYLSRESHISLEEVWSGNNLSLAALCSLVALISALVFAGADRGAKPDYTLRRLAATERQSFLCRAAHNTLCFFLFWGVQLAAALGLCLAWRELSPALWGDWQWENQTLLLAFCRVPYLHALLPLGDWYLYLRNVLLCAALGFVTARKPVGRGLMGVLLLSLAVSFPWRLGNWMTPFVLNVLLAVHCIVWCTAYPHGLEDPEDMEKEAQSDGAKA